MIRVGVFISGGEKGGSRYQVMSLARGLKGKVETIFFTFFKGPLFYEIEESGFKNHFFESKLPFSSKVFKDVLKRVSEENLSLIHTYGVRGNFYGRRIARKLNIPVITSITSFIREDYSSKIKGFIFEKIDNTTIGIPKVVIVPSRALMRDVLRRNPALDVRVVPLGVEIPDGFFPKEEFFGKNDFVIGSIMRMERVKNPLFLIDVFKAVHLKEKRAKLMIVGDGSMRTLVEKRIEEYGLKDSVIITGFRKDAKRFYGVFDVFVSTSIKEGFSVSVLEAMASSLPVVVSDSGGVREMVEDGVNGFIIEDFDVEKFKERILLFKDKRLKEEFGRRNKMKVKERFTVERMCEDTLKIYKEVIG